MWVIGVNAISVIVGSMIGLLGKRWIKVGYLEAIKKALGVSIFLIGIAGVLRIAFYIEDNRLYTQYELLLIVSLALGTFLGELLKIEDGLNRLGLRMEEKWKTTKFAEGFISATLIYCVGAMAILGSFAAASGDPSILYIKSLLDGVTSIFLAASVGYGVAFSAIPLLLYQGMWYGLFFLIGGALDSGSIDALSIVGYALIVCLGLNWIHFKQIKVANMLPALLVALAYYFIWRALL